MKLMKRTAALALSLALAFALAGCAKEPEIGRAHV